MDDGRLSYTVSYPLEGGWVHLLKLGGLTLASILIIPYVILIGYFFRSLEATANGATEPPALGEWKALLVEGGYGIAALIPLYVPYGVVYAALLTYESNAAVQVLNVLVYLTILYVLPAVMVRYVTTRHWRAAYTTQILDDVLSWNYLGAYILFAAVYLALSIVVLLAVGVSAITIVGPIIVALAGLNYLYLAYTAYWGQYYRNNMAR